MFLKSILSSSWVGIGPRILSAFPTAVSISCRLDMVRSGVLLPPPRYSETFSISFETSNGRTDLPIGGKKDDLVSRILDNIIALPEKTKKANPKVVGQRAIIKSSGNEESQLRKWLDTEFDQSEIKDACSRLDLSTRGDKDQLLDMLLEQTKDSPKRTLGAWDYYTLNSKAEDLGIPTRRSKKEQIEEFLKAFFGESMKPEEPKQAMSKAAVVETVPINNVLKRSLTKTNMISWSKSLTPGRHRSPISMRLDTRESFLRG